MAGGAAQPARRLRDHAGRALHQRLEHERRVWISLFLLRGEFLFNLARCIPNGISGIRARRRAPAARG